MGDAHRLRHGCAEVDAQRQGIDEHAQRPVGSFAALQAPHQYRAEHHIGAVGEHPEHPCPGQVRQAGGAHPQASRLLAQAACQAGIDGQAGFFDGAAIPLHIGQAERQGRRVEVAQHVAEERLVAGIVGPQARLGDVGAVRHWRRQALAVARQHRLHLAGDDFHGGVVQGQVVELQHRHHTLVGRVVGMQQAQQRCTRQVQALVAGVEACLQGVDHRAGGQAVDCAHLHPRFTPYHLHGVLQPFTDHSSTQDVVPVDNLLQGTRPALQLRQVVERQARLQQIRIALCGAQVMVQDALLQRRQRVDLLHIGRAAGYGGDDTVDTGLVERDQAEHVRGNVAGTLRHTVGRHLHFAPAAHRSSQSCQRRLGKQHTHIGAKAGLAHALDQGHGQQRMAAQFEEMVVAADLRDLEQLGPDRCQGGFDLTLRSLERTVQHGITAWLRQGTAVKLAVGGQRQPTQADIGGRQHVVRQLALQLLVQFGNAWGRLTGGEISHQALVARHIFAHHHRRLADTGARPQARFDLAQFDTEAAQLDLLVGTAQVAQGTVGLPAGQVATAVHARTRLAAERVVEEAFGGQRGLAEVTQGDAVATDVQLTDRADWQRLLTRIEHIAAAIADRFADGNAARIDRTDGVGGTERRGFGRAIAIEQVHRGAMAQYPVDHGRVQYIAANYQVTQLGEGRQQVVGKLVEQACSQPQHRHALLQQHLTQGLTRQHLVLVDDHHCAAVEQRRPDFQGAGVERRVGGERDAVLAGEVGEAVVDHQAHDGPVRYLHALGGAGRAGGIHDVGGAFGIHHQARRLLRVAGKVKAVQLDAQGVAHRVFTAEGEQHPRLAVIEHESLAFDRRIAVQRHEHRSALAGRQLRRQQFDAAWQQQRNPVARAYAQAQQVMGQAVGVLFELCVAPLPVTVQHRRRSRAERGIGVEQGMQRLFAWVIAAGGVEALKHPLALGRRQAAHLVQGHGRCLCKGLGQLFEGGAQQLADLRAIDLWHRLHGQHKGVAQVVDIDHQWVVAALMRGQLFDTLPGLAQLGLGRGTVAEVEQAGEQRLGRGHCAATLGQGQRSLLVGQQTRQTLVGQAHALGHRHRAHAHPQRQGIDEHAQRPFGPLAALQAAEQHGAEHYLFAPGQLRQHLPPGLVHQAGDADTQHTGLLTQSAGQGAVQCQAAVQHPAGVTVRIAQAEHGGGFVDIAQQLAEHGLVGLGIGAQARLGHVVAVRHAGVRQGLALQHRGDLGHQLLDSRMVENDVVNQQGRLHATFAWAWHQADQGGLVQVEGGGASLAGHCRRAAPDDLHGFVQALPVDAGAQDIVAGNDLIQRRGEGIEFGLPRERKARLQHIGVGALAGEVVVEDTLLQRGQAVDVLDIGHAPWDLPDQGVDGRLGQLGERQHVRGYAGAIYRDAVGRHAHAGFTADGGGQRSQGRLAEQHADIGMQALLTQARGEADCQQRMAAQFEEVVVAPYPFHAQQFGPDRSQQGFGVAFGGLVLAVLQGFGVWQRQGLAVELAVGAQRQRRQVHEQRRHHERRQVGQ
ncbi:hypothetical protein D3C76_387480 [compost metagenome]